MPEASTEQRDPREGPTPPFPEQQQTAPGSDADAPTEGRSRRGELPRQRQARRSRHDRHRRRQRHRPRRRPRVRPRGGRRAHLVPGRGRRCGGDRRARRGCRTPARCSSTATSPTSTHAGASSTRGAEAFGRLDVLVNNAATQTTHGSFEEHHRRGGRAHLPHQRLPALRPLSCRRPASARGRRDRQHGLDPGLRSRRRRSCTTPPRKGAIVTFTKGLSKELIEHRIRVNAVAPGPVWTPLIASTILARVRWRRSARPTPRGAPRSPRSSRPPTSSSPLPSRGSSRARSSA